jgi:hypothetical protein
LSHFFVVVHLQGRQSKILREYSINEIAISISIRVQRVDNDIVSTLRIHRRLLYPYDITMRVSSSFLTAFSVYRLSVLALVQSWVILPKVITQQGRRLSCSPLSAGFGASDDKTKGGTAAASLKPKQQWVVTWR